MSTITSTLKPLSKSASDFLLSLPSSELKGFLSRMEKAKPGSSKWITSQLHQTSSNPANRKREADRARRAAVTARGQEIGQIRKVVNPERRNRARLSLRFHLETYHAQTFNCPWANYHLVLMERGEYVTHHGGWFAFAMPRGGGKSSIAEGLVEWAILHGHKHWPLLLGATDDKAVRRLKNIKTELRRNALLAEDFPEICQPVRALGRSARRAEGQLCCGAPTAMEWSDNQIALPTIVEEEWERWAEESFTSHSLEKPAKVGGAIVTALGLLGDIRGLAVKTESLDSIRPDMAIPDDPQTRESSKSYIQSQHRAAIITGDVAYLNGPTSKMSVLMPGTVINKGDMVDQMLDRDLNPEWRGERHKMVISFPVREDLWDRYAELRRGCLRLDQSMEVPNNFYRDNREAMDEGAEVSWASRVEDGCLSAIQHAMNLKLRDPIAFAAEAQNEPITSADFEQIVVPVTKIMTKIGHLPRGVVPQYVNKLCVHIDVQQRLLYWAAVGASLQFEATLIDANTSPQQGRSYFSYKEQLRTIQDVYPGLHLDQQLYAAIQELIDDLANRTYLREDGAEMKIDLILVDCGWEDQTVIKACRESPWRAIVMPSQGLPILAKDTPLSLRRPKAGEVKGHDWLVKPKPDNKSVLYMQVDANSWKTQTHLSLAVESGPGSLKLWSDIPEKHRLTAEHLNAETAVKVTAGERTCWEWSLKPGADNHRFDNVYQAMAGLSRLGCILPNAHEAPPGRRRKPRTFGGQRAG